MTPIINILIRNKYRPELFRRCIRSIAVSGYSRVRLIIACESPESMLDVVTVFKNSEIIPVIAPVKPDRSKPHYWNLYCNDLKSRVTDGWFFYMDNDDFLEEGSLLKLVDELNQMDPGTGLICQFRRNGKAKPIDQLMDRKIIEKGRIGGGCIVLHHSQKDIADWDGDGPAGDYRFIARVASKLPLRFVKLVLQEAGNNGLHGK
jgi:hypothetical protein